MGRLRQGARGRVVAITSSVTIMLVAVATPLLAQEPSPVPDESAGVPVRTLVDIPVPTEPRVPTDPESPDVLAERWFAATSDEARRDLILDVLAGIGMGVYTTDGTPILYGAEKGEDDPWLYDFEVAILASDPTTTTPTSFDDLAVTLAAVISTADGHALTSAELADAVAAGVTAAVNDPSDPLGFVLRLARELELRASGQDLREAVPVDAPLEPLAAALIEWDILVPFAAAAGAGDPGTATEDGWIAAAPRLVLAAGPPPMTPAMSFTAAVPRTAQACAQIRDRQLKGEWSLGTIAAGLVRLGSRVIDASAPGQALHDLLLRIKLKATGESFHDFHYAHSSEQKPPLTAKLRVFMDVPLPDAVVACGPLAGRGYPRNEPVPGATVTWDGGQLARHGSADCGAACTTTDERGEATWRFTPKREPEPAGLGPERKETVGLGARVNVVLPGKFSAEVPLSVSWDSGDITATWHREHRFELEIDSLIAGGGGPGAIRGIASAKGRIPLVWNERKSYLEGDGVLKVRSEPATAKRCQQSSTSGKGIIDWQVYAVSVYGDPDPAVEAVVGPGPTTELPDKLTSRCPGSRPTKFSTWESFFARSHLRDLTAGGVGGGYRLDGFVWQANDDTFRNGGKLATYKYREGCPRPGCTGTTTFTVWVYPVGD